MLTLRTKRIALIALFIASVVAIAAAIYFLFFRPLFGPETPVDEEAVTPSGSLPSAQTGAPSVYTPPTTGRLEQADEIASGGVTQVTQLTSGSILSPTSCGTEACFYNPQDDRFYTIDADGNVVSLSSKTFPEASSIVWNDTADKAVIEFPDESNVIYDFVSQTQITLPSHWEDFDFSPTTDEIAAKSIALDPDNRWLVISKTDGTQTETIRALGENEDKVDLNISPNAQIIGFADADTTLTTGLDRQTIIPLGRNDENFEGLTVEGMGFDSLWSPSGRQLLYSVSGSYSDYRPLLWSVSATSSSMGEDRRSLGINTWVEKCVFASEDIVYCGVPTSLPANAGLQPSLYDNEPDNLYRLDLSSGKSSLIAIPSEDVTMEYLSLSSDGSLLYFTDALTGRLQMIRLQ